MKYDFSTVFDRKGKDAIAFDAVGMPGMAPQAPLEGYDFIPMWVADMNFKVLPAIQEAIIERVNHPAYGYFNPSDEYYNLIIEWQKKRNGVVGLTSEHIGYENGVLGGVVAAVSSVAAPGDAVLVHSPTYIGFTKSLENNGFKLIHSPLYKDDKGVYRMDYADMDAKIKENHIHVAVMCSPHNPTGRVWTKEELENAMKVFEENDVTVISDEIWSDIVLNDNKHIPTQSISDYARKRTVAFYAPSKTFNLAGLVGSYHIIYDKTLREMVDSRSSKCHYNMMNVLSMYALIGAYKSEGYIWVDELRETLSGNVNYAIDFINKNFPDISVTKPEGTYILFLDCTRWCEKNSKTIDEVLKAGWNAGVGWQDGRPFHGPCHIRMNLALPFSRVEEAFNRLKTVALK